MNQNVLSAFVCLLLCAIFLVRASPEDHPRFSVRDDIELTQFGDVYFWIRGDVVVSPAGDKVLVHTVRASLDDDAVHDELRVYSIDQLRRFVNSRGADEQVEPTWKIEESGTNAGGDGPLISGSRWLEDESAIAFLLQTDRHHRRLCLAKLGSSAVTWLSSQQQDVLGFSIRSESNYVFTVPSRETKENMLRGLDSPYQVGTGRAFWDVMSPAQRVDHIGRGDLWAANGGPPAPVIDPVSGGQIFLYEAGSQGLSLSPDGKTLVTVMPVRDVPKHWESLYPPPFSGDAYGMRAGTQDLHAAEGFYYVSEYATISLATGRLTFMTDTPTAAAAGWFEPGPAEPAWSSDGSSVLLPGTFLPNNLGSDRAPCLVAIEIKTRASECVRRLKRDLADGFETGYERTDQVMFAPGKSDEVLLKSSEDTSGGNSVRRYLRSSDGAWRAEDRRSESIGDRTLEVSVAATFKNPPVLVATDTQTKKSRTVLDPNPQMKDIGRGEPELYNWKDRTGRKWEGILYKPVDYRSGVKYPLVIQNHGFSEDRFSPSGGFPSAFVAEELASSGIMVLQVRDCPGRATPIEGPCNVEGYESAVDELSGDGLVDGSRIGIIGFSRTVYYVLEALTTSQLHFRAASITDGINVGYVDYLHSVGPSDAYRREAEAMIGTSPFGSGLLDWIKKSPLFNMDKVTTPLRVVATRSGSLMEMWEPYALLEAMNKPVDLIVLNTEEHVITDPKVRLAAQGGNVDWFRFWLQGYEDPDPVKSEQYARWHKLRELEASR
jgi:dipeptidyl aminopeptidase/acylaminoacyl peptidase